MFKKIFSIFIFILIYNFGFGQKGGNIKYYFPDTVETTIFNYLKLRPSSDRREEIYLKLDRDGDIYKLYIDNCKKTKLTKCDWGRLTNRFAVINTMLIPLIFDYDEKFSTTGEAVGRFGARDGEIKKSVFIIHGPVIYFSLRDGISKTEGF